MSNPEDRKPLVTGMFRDRDSAERAYNTLRQRGYTEKEIHVIMSDDTRKKHFSDDKTGVGNKALEGTGVGAVVGGAVGATLIGILATGTALAIPGLGLVIAGPLAGALAGAGVGSLTGGLVGGLVGLGIPEDRAKFYEKGIQEGGIVVGVNPRNDEDARYFESEWTASEAARR